MKIALCSVLKPLDDPRMFEKIGRTLSAGGHQIHVYGSGEQSKSPKGIVQVYFGKIKRKSVKRILFQAFLLGNLLKLRPKIVVCHAVELLPLLLAGKFFLGYKVIYDIQENYFLNIKYQQVYQGVVKSVLLSGFKQFESYCAKKVDSFWVAEKSYFNELSFLNDRALYLPNVSLGLAPVEPYSFDKQKALSCLIYGNISHEYGTLEGIEVFDQVKTIFEGSFLKIIGKCSNEKYLNSLVEVTEKRTDIICDISSEGVSFLEIQKTLKEVDLVIMSYQENRSIDFCIPTKMYECISQGKAMLVRDNSYWSALCTPYSAALFYQASLNDIDEVLKKLVDFKFYGTSKEVPRVSWGDYESDLLTHIETL